ncbi:MAG: hypothetical protein J1G38_00435 [Clostridiales bacterium]|nr:hypothetical protein [Clostridiales bacterium]
MTGFRAKLKNISGDGKRRNIIFACAMIAASLAMFLIALTAPFQYYSNREVLHIVYFEVEEGEDEGMEAEVVVNETRRIHQSLFQMFEAVTRLSDASALHAATLGEIEDQREYEVAREKLTELREQYSNIVLRTMSEAQKRGIAQDSEEYVDLLADNLSEMNLMALDMLETAFASDNTGAYEALYSGIVLGLFNAIINVLITTAAVIAAAFSVYWLIMKRQEQKYVWFWRIYAALSVVGLFLCVFNPVIPPAASPLALACVAVSTFFAAGLFRSLISDEKTAIVVRNAVGAAAVSIGALCLAAIPSFTVYVNGLGGQYLYYAGTVGTGYFSRITAANKIGLDIEGSAITVAFVLGIAACALTVIAAAIALGRLYRGATGKGGSFTSLLAVISAIIVELAAAIGVMTSNLQDDGMLVKYIVGACWYVTLAFMLGTAVFYWVFAAVEKKKAAALEGGQTVGGEKNAVEEDSENSENSEKSEQISVEN